MDRVSSRRRTLDPYATETEAEGEQRTRQILSLRFTETSRTLVGETWQAFPVHVNPDVAVAKYEALYGRLPTEFAYVYTESGTCWLTLGPVSA